jgi:Asp-tRNA(Asn)/Glu-tRNA(Gln) amidotransferase A subunit family amidase
MIFGEAKNPLDTTRSCGGSSGGDAGLVAARCVPFAVGTDIGGSLRFPAAFCGIYGFKPTQNRLTKRGCAPCRKERFNMHNHLTGTAGPMGASVDDLVTGMMCQLDPKIHLYDPYCPPSPWRDNEYQEVQADKAKTKVGIL